MPEPGVQVLGYPELAAGSRVLFERIEDAATDAFAEVAEKVARDVAGRVPRKTGKLAGSVQAAQEPGGASVAMGSGVPYAGFVEYGGRGHPHSPEGNYLFPAATDAIPQVVAAGVKAAEDEIGGMSWPSPS